MNICLGSRGFGSLHLYKVVFLFSQLSLLAAIGYGQASPSASPSQTRIYGSEDNDIPVPSITLPLGTQDQAAVQAIRDFLIAAKLSEWQGLKANGTFLSPGIFPNKEFPATLSISQEHFTRLDVSLPNGQQSIRIQGRIGKILESDGTFQTLSFAAASGNLFFFSTLADLRILPAEISILDRGPAMVGNTAFHRVTLQKPIYAGKTPARTSQAIAIDLYFDVNTKLLYKSVMSERLSSTDGSLSLQVVTYGDYRSVDGVLIPFSYWQTLNGQRQWALQLSDAQAHVYEDKNYFRF